MAWVTGSGAEVLERSLPPSLSCGADTLQDTYELPRCVRWVQAGHYSKVCLQFPDELLGDAASVCSALTHQLSQPVYLLADTTFSSCCVDEVAAEHVGADAVIHFGRSCLSPNHHLPVLLVFTRIPVEVCAVSTGLRAAVSCPLQPLILLHDTRCHYLADVVFEKLKESFPNLVPCTIVQGTDNCPQETTGSSVPNTEVASDERSTYITSGSAEVADGSNIKGGSTYSTCNSPPHSSEMAGDGGSTCNISGTHSANTEVASGISGVEGSAQSTSASPSPSTEVVNSGNDGQRTHEPTSITFSGRRLCVPPGLAVADHHIIFLGPPGPTFQNFLLRFPENTFYQVNPDDGKVDVTSGTKLVMGRSAKLEMVKDAGIIGILVGTLGVARYRAVIQRLRRVIRAAGKRSYTVVVGKPNEPKLANVSEVEVWVHVACPESTVVERSTDPVLHRLLVAPWELEVALLPGQHWTLAFETNFQELLAGGSRHVEEVAGPRPEEASVSLLTNRTQRLGLQESEDEGETGAAGPVMEQQDQQVAQLHQGGGGQVLQGRSWQGLDPSLPPPDLGPVVEGSRGVAAAYQHESTS